MKKYSKYNVGKNLTTMCNYKEALKLLDAGKVSAENLFELEARIRLYHSLFKNYAITEKDKKEFEIRKTNILKGLSADDMQEYISNVNHKVEDDYYEAMEEFQSRINHINPNSSDGKEENPDAFDISKLEDDLDYAYPLTRYGRLTNLPINRNYKCVDEGIYVYDKAGADWIRVADPLSIKSLPVDYENNRQYIEIQYYDSHRGGTVATMTIPIDELSKAKYEVLQHAGIVVDNPKYLTKYFNDLRSINPKTKKISYTVASMSYDFAVDENGNVDYTKMVGIDDDAQIIKTPEFYGLDKSIAQRKGTVEGFIEFLTDVSKGIYEMDFQLLLASSLVGVTQAIVNGVSDFTAPLSIFFSSKTSIGKNLLGAISNNVWCAPTATSLRVTSESSNAFLGSDKNHLGVLPIVMVDTQDLFDKYGEAELISMIFSHSNGRAGGKCYNTGTPRPDMTWKCPFISFGEVSMLGNTYKTNGGADARVLVIDLHYNQKNGQRYLTINNPKSYIKMENKNYGVYGPAFVNVIKTMNPEDIFDRFLEIADELTELGTQEKQANSIALLVLTLEILRKANLLPTEWKVADAVTVLDWIGVKEVNDPTDIMYKLLSSYVFTDPSYLASDDKYLTVDAPRAGRTEAEVFEAKAKSAEAVRGRLLWQKKDETGNWVECAKSARERTLLLIPNFELNQLFGYLTKESELKGFAFDKKRWLDNGWLLEGNDGPYLQRDTFKMSITRARDPKNKERYYAIVLYEEKDAE